MNFRRIRLFTLALLVALSMTGCGAGTTTAIIAGATVAGTTGYYLLAADNQAEAEQRRREQAALRKKEAEKRAQELADKRAQEKREREAKNAGRKHRHKLIGAHTFAESCNSLAKRTEDALLTKGYSYFIKKSSKHITDWQWEKGYRKRHMITFEPQNSGCVLDVAVVYDHHNGNNRTGTDFGLQYDLLAASNPQRAKEIDEAAANVEQKALEAAESDAESDAPQASTRQ